MGGSIKIYLTFKVKGRTMLVKSKTPSTTTKNKQQMENKEQETLPSGRKKRKSSKFNDTMTIQEYVAAVEQWKKDGDDLQKVGEKFQSVMAELSKRSRVSHPTTSTVPQTYYNNPQSFPGMQPQKTPELGAGNFENSQNVSLVSPEQHLADLQNTIAEQVRQASINRKTEQIDPF